MREIVSAVCQALGRPVPRLVIPSAILKAATTISRSLGDPGQLGKRFEKFVRDDVYSSAKFASAFNFSPLTSLTDGIRREVSFRGDRSMYRH
jgi:hypothetical protein